jgi:hypothetical protein
MQLDFPMKAFLQVKEEMLAARAALNKEKAEWQAVRDALDEAAAHTLDEAFKAAFEKLDELFRSVRASTLEEVLQTLRGLVQKGASAQLLGNHELGAFNLAMLVKQLDSITEKEALELAGEIIRLTITAGAGLYAQKAYAGNGGSNSLEWLCLYLAGGVSSDLYLSTTDQYNCCYKIFPWIADDEDIARVHLQHFYPFEQFMGALRESREVEDLQEQMILRWISLGYPPVVSDGQHIHPYFFSRLATLHVQWLTMLFPFEEEPLQAYLNKLKKCLNVPIAQSLLNGFTSNHKARKHFKAFFSRRPHWLLQWIITSAPEIVFSLVKRNEQDMLAPFLKHFKRELAGLRNAEGLTLLQHAQSGRRVTEHTIELLRRATFPE